MNFKVLELKKSGNRYVLARDLRIEGLSFTVFTCQFNIKHAIKVNQNLSNLGLTGIVQKDHFGLESQLFMLIGNRFVNNVFLSENTVMFEEIVDVLPEKIEKQEKQEILKNDDDDTSQLCLNDDKLESIEPEMKQDEQVKNSLLKGEVKLKKDGTIDKRKFNGSWFRKKQ